jgi:hypothetical protein
MFGKLSSRAAMRGSIFALAALSFATANPARAEFKLRYPDVEYHEFEYEHNGATSFDNPKSGRSNNQSYVHEFGVSLVPNWKIELELETEAASGENLHYSATTIENTIQLLPEGKYWLDLGLFVEYSKPAASIDAQSVTFGPLLQKELPDTLGLDSLHTLNLLFTREFGAHHSDTTPLFLAWQSRLRLHPLFEPGFELYSLVGDLDAPGKLAGQQHRLGPMFAGVYNLGGIGEIKYEAGYLFGLTRATEKGAVRWRLEYEIGF